MKYLAVLAKVQLVIHLDTYIIFACVAVQYDLPISNSYLELLVLLGSFKLCIEFHMTFPCRVSFLT